MKRNICLMVSVCLVAGVVFATDDSKVVVRSGDVVVTELELQAAIDSLPEDYREYAVGPGKRAFAADVLRMKRLAEAAEESGVAEQPEVQAQVALSRANTLANAQVTKMRESIAVEESRIETLYEERKDQLERAKARHILIAFEGSPAAGENPPTEDQAKATAEKILERIRGGEDFAEIARAESDDKGSGARGGDLGAFGRGQMVPAFDDAVFSAKPGELAPIVKTQFGYHVIEVQERTTTPLADVKERLEDEIAQQILQEQIEAMDANAEVSYDEEYFGPVTATPPAE